MRGGFYRRIPLRRQRGIRTPDFQLSGQEERGSGQTCEKRERERERERERRREGGRREY
jgi:hypothetical protein